MHRILTSAAEPTKMMIMKLLVLALAAVVPATALFNQDIETEYMWCCQDAKCWDACLKLCMNGKQDFCVNGSLHPGSGDNGNGGFTNHADGTFDPFNGGSNPFQGFQGEIGGGRRQLQDPETELEGIETGCGDRPPGNVNDVTYQESPEFIEWFDCFEEFFLGNKYAKTHCEMVLPHVDTCCASATCGGEPHFKTWVSQWYDYHGEGDLNFIHAPSFAHGMGLDVHIRTKIRYAYSFIESAAIKIGTDVIEISGFGQYILNGVENADLESAQMGAFEITHVAESRKLHHFEINVGDHKIKVKTSKDFVSVTLDDGQPMDYIDSVGMMGRYGVGTLLGRDGKTVFTLENINDFGQEWQVRPEEPQLFANSERAPQYPEKCRLPDKSATEQRRLAESAISQEQAESACSGWSSTHQAQCVFDVMSTGDLELADAGGY